MTVYRRPDSKFWWIRLERTTAGQHKLIQVSSGTTVKRIAKLKEAELRVRTWPELESGRNGKMPTLAEFTSTLFPFWTRELKGRPGTRKFYMSALKPVLEFPDIANAELSAIRPALIERFKTHRDRQGVGIVTIQHSLRALRRALRIAVKHFEYRFTPTVMDLREEPGRDFVIDEATLPEISGQVWSLRRSDCPWRHGSRRKRQGNDDRPVDRPV